MPKVVSKDLPSNVEELEDQSLQSMFREYVKLKKVIDDMTARQNIIKRTLMEFVEENGEEDDKGHKWFDMPAYEGYAGMQKQRRVSQSIDEDACENVLDHAGLKARCYELTPVLNEEEVMKCFSEGLLDENDLDLMFPKKITNAFVLTKE